MSYQPTKISDLSRIGKKKNKSQMILVSWDEETNTFDITTWGSNKKYCEEAAKGGQFFINKMKEAGIISTDSIETIHEDKNNLLKKEKK